MLAPRRTAESDQESSLAVRMDMTSVQEALAAAKAEYLQLFEQFKLSNQLSDERDMLYKSQVEHHKLEYDAMRKSILELRYEVRLQRSAKKAFEKDVLLLEQTSQMLENKEVEITNRLEDLTVRNSELEVENAKLISDNNTLRKTIKDDMISIDEYHVLSRRIESNEIKIASMVPKEAYAKASDKLAELKRRMENEFVSLDEYNRLRERHSTDLTNMSTLVPVKDYNKLLFKYEALEAQLQDMVPREKLDLLVEKLAEVQRRVENDMVGLGEYREALGAAERSRALMEAQAEDFRRKEADSVPVKDYNKLLYKYDALESRVGDEYVSKDIVTKAREALSQAQAKHAEAQSDLQKKIECMISADEFKKVVSVSESLKHRLEKEQLKAKDAQLKAKDAAEALAMSEATISALQKQLDKEGRAHEATVKSIKAQYERLYNQVHEMQEANGKLHDGSVAEYEGMIEEMTREMREMRRQVYESSVDQRVLEDMQGRVEEMQGRVEAAELAAERYKVIAEESKAQLVTSRRDMEMVHSAVIVDLLQGEGFASVEGGLAGAGGRSLLSFHRTSPTLEDYHEAKAGGMRK